MAKKKNTSFYILEILKKYSDDDHPLTTQQIINILSDEYGVELERKAVSKVLIFLENELDYGINHIEKKGYYLLEREYEPAEIQFLVDAVLSSKSISNSEAQILTNKILSCLSEYQKKNYEYLIKSEQKSKTTSNAFINIDMISNAIKEKKNIGFYYMRYSINGKLVNRWDNEKKTYCSPYYLVNNFGRYYLIAKSLTKDGIAIYRVDLMKDIVIKTYDATPMEDESALGPNFNINEFIDSHIYMFGGDLVDAQIELLDENAITYVYDWFGIDTKIKKVDDKVIANIKCNGNGLFYWCMQYCEHIKVLSPEPLKNRIINTIKELNKKYEI